VNGAQCSYSKNICTPVNVEGLLLLDRIIWLKSFSIMLVRDGRGVRCHVIQVDTDCVYKYSRLPSVRCLSSFPSYMALASTACRWWPDTCAAL